MPLHLYEVSAELEIALAKAAAIAEESEGVIPDSLSDEIDALQLERAGKLLACGRAYKNRDAEAEAIKAEAKRLTVRARVLENQTEWLKRYMQAHVIIGEKVSDEAVAISWRKSTAVEILDPALIPDQYNRITVVPAKDEIKKALSAGMVIAGAKLEERINLTIK
jgi:hypothetical protein